MESGLVIAVNRYRLHSAWIWLCGLLVCACERRWIADDCGGVVGRVDVVTLWWWRPETLYFMIAASVDTRCLGLYMRLCYCSHCEIITSQQV